MSQKPATLWNLVGIVLRSPTPLHEVVTFSVEVTDWQKYIFLETTHRDLSIGGVFETFPRHYTPKNQITY